ncbi:hypothetical protein [Halobaculum sp. MBLA0143]|uniref:hypothetical protein n=1 Tax=Halobaculum sp. MBLA0143 TaxID=3079933 RepID=UPI00352478ED
MVKRRAYLAALCSGPFLTGGCLASDEPESPSVLTDHRLTITERGCGDRQHDASLSYDTATNQLHVEGTYAKTEECGPLGLGTNRRPNNEKVDIEIYPVDRADCPSCRRYYEYELTATFRDTPSGVALVYLETDDPFGEFLDVESESTE